MDVCRYLVPSSLDMIDICGGRKQLKKSDICGVTMIEGYLAVGLWFLIFIKMVSNYYKMFWRRDSLIVKEKFWLFMVVMLVLGEITTY